MLDDREDRILRDIARHLRDVDSGLDRTDPDAGAGSGSASRTGSHRRPATWAVVAAVVGVVLGIGLTALGLVGQALLVVALGVVPVLWWWWHHHGHGGRDVHPAPDDPDDPAVPPPGG